MAHTIPAPTYEYQLLPVLQITNNRVDGDTSGDMATLNALGLVGWHVVAVVVDAANQTGLMLERPL